MGILDDLAMGFGMKARTEDYDARTARTIARNEGVDIGQSRVAQQYLGGRGYAEGYRPQVAQDSRPFMQRLLYSPEDRQSPTPYAIGPISMDKPLSFGALSAFSPMGMLFGALSGGRQQAQAQQDPRVTEAIASLRNPANWTANRGGGILPKPASNNGIGMDTDFRRLMRKSESGGRSDILTPTGRGDMAGGYYQFTPARLKDYSTATGEEVMMENFIADPDLQSRVMDWHEQDILDYAMDNGLDKYIGQEIGGVMIDPSAIVAMAHLGGRRGMRKFLESGGEYNPSDRFGTKISDYGKKFGGLDLYGLTPTTRPKLRP